MDFSFQNNRPPKKGFVLLADPFSKNDFFSRSVIYLCDHNEEGTFGFVLNHFIDFDLSSIAENFPNFDSKISVGGPVQTDNIYFIHTLGNALSGSVEIADSIYMGGDYEQLVDRIKNNAVSPREVRFFLGYSGWGPSQLEEELEQNSWIVAPVLNPLEVMDVTIENPWQRFMKREGKKYDILSKAPLSFNDN